jgi:hypothetical protein
VDLLDQGFFFLGRWSFYDYCFEVCLGEVDLPRAVTGPAWISSPTLKHSVPARFVLPTQTSKSSVTPCAGPFCFSCDLFLSHRIKKIEFFSVHGSLVFVLFLRPQDVR